MVWKRNPGWKTESRSLKFCRMEKREILAEKVCVLITRLIWNPVLPALWYTCVGGLSLTSDPVWAGLTFESWLKGNSWRWQVQWSCVTVIGSQVAWANKQFLPGWRPREAPCLCLVLVSACLWQVNNKMHCLIPDCLASLLCPSCSLSLFMSHYVRCSSPLFPDPGLQCSLVVLTQDVL